MGYFQLALAAALEDQTNPNTLYVVFMKLAEIHCNHMPDAHLCQAYRDRAQSLKRVLAFMGNSVAQMENMDDADRQPDRRREKCLDADMGYSERCQDRSGHRLRTTNTNSEERSADVNLGEDSSLKGQSHGPADTDSQSRSDSILTGSFDTAKEHISDSSSTTDTYQNPKDGKDSEIDSDHSLPSQIPANHTSEVTGHVDTRDTDSDTQGTLSTPTKDADSDADPTQTESEEHKL